MASRSIRRLTLAGGILVVLGPALYWLINQGTDIELASDTSGFIAAVRDEGDSRVAVVVDKSGKVSAVPDTKPGTMDQEPVWDPAGNRLYFLSDREEKSINIFRWDPTRPADLDRRSIDKASRSGLSFGTDSKNGNPMGLLIVRGAVHEFTPKTVASNQLLPPLVQETSGGGEEGGLEEGSEESLKASYSRIGTNIRLALWFGNRRFIACVVRREEEGEALVVQDMEPNEKGKMNRPIELFHAARFYLAERKNKGGFVFSAVNITGPLAEGQTALPFKHGIFIMDPLLPQDQALQPVLAVESGDSAFGQVVCSEQGDSLLFQQGKHTSDGNMEIVALYTSSAEPGASGSVRQIEKGPISDPAFSPDGKTIAYVRGLGTNKRIILSNYDGANRRDLTSQPGAFSSPKFSPKFK
jgi:hypothetical protein